MALTTGSLPKQKSVRCVRPVCSKALFWNVHAGRVEP